jgi:hypothetical protein
MVLLDPDAHRDVHACGFLGEQFARRKGKQADSSVAGAYSTLGLAGENTLVELFGTTMPGPVSLVGGLVFSFEVPGSAIEAQRLLADEANLPSHHELVYRAVDGTEDRQPWYHLLSADLGAGSPLVLFLNEVTPEYFAALGANPGPDGELRRREYLTAALGGPPSEEHLLRDITGVTVRLRPDRADRIGRALATLGFHREKQAGAAVVTGSGVAITLVAEESAPEGVTAIDLALSKAPEHPTTLRFGATSELELTGDATARWTFTPVSGS